MILSLFGKLVDPTDEYNGSEFHRQFSHHFVTFITCAVSIVTPLSFLLLFGGYFHLIPGPDIVTQFILFYAVLEVVWFLYCFHLKRRFNVETSFPHLDNNGRRLYLDLFLQHCPNPWSTLARWFYKHNPTMISPSWMKEWVAWAFFSKHVIDLEISEKVELNELMDKILDKFPLPVREEEEEDGVCEEEIEGKLNFMRLHFDKIVVQQKPLIAYIAISLMQFGGSCFLYFSGFQHHVLYNSDNTLSTLSYWSYQPPTKSLSSPIFLMPGIGIGVTMYVNIVKSLLTTGRPIYILNLPHISLKVVQSVPSMTETLYALDHIYDKHNLKSCTYLAHSYGSIVTAWVIKYRPASYINNLIMVDPVCFALWEPDLIYNFLYRTALTPIQRVAQYFVARDLCVAYTLYRRFWWLENLLIPEDIPVQTNVFLSSHDFIIDSGTIANYLRSRMMTTEEEGNNNAGNNNNNNNGKKKVEFNIVEMKGLSHGSFLNSQKYTKQIQNCL